MSNWPTPFIARCPICGDYVQIKITKRGMRPTCPGPAQKFSGSHYCKEFGWDVLIVGRKSGSSLPHGEKLGDIPEGRLFPEPAAVKKRKLKFKFKGEKT